jgi:hypothetical protein
MQVERLIKYFILAAISFVALSSIVRLTYGILRRKDSKAP